MSINTEIQKLETNLANAYLKCLGKGATMPTNQNFDNLGNCIKSFSTVRFGINREISNGKMIIPQNLATFSLPNGARDLADYSLYSAFFSAGLGSANLSSLRNASGRQCCYNAFESSSISSVDLSNLMSVTGYQSFYRAFYSCKSLTSIVFNSLTTINANQAFYYAFNNCSNLTSASFPSLVTVSGSNALNGIFGSTKLQQVDFPNLVTIGENSSSVNTGQFGSFLGNSANITITSLTFPKLEKIYCTGGGSASYGTFGNNSRIQKFYFPKLNTITYGNGATSNNQNACKYIFGGCSSLTEIHFGAANQAAIEASPGYSTAWGRGAGNVTIYFDL